MLTMKVLSVGVYQSNCFLLITPQTQQGILIDPGDQADQILEWIEPAVITRILITHGHSDHVGALTAVRAKLEVPVGIHPIDAEKFRLDADFYLEPGDMIPIGEDYLEVVHIPGHTAGSIALRLIEDGTCHRVIVGDAIFPGGPGHTQTPADLTTALDALEKTVFTWNDGVTLYPGHGEPTTVGQERAPFMAFRDRPLPVGLCGDVTWL